MPFFSFASVDFAFVVVVAEEVVEVARARLPGCTIGSSARRCENVHRVTKRGFISGAVPPDVVGVGDRSPPSIVLSISAPASSGNYPNPGPSSVSPLDVTGRR